MKRCPPGFQELSVKSLLKAHHDYMLCFHYDYCQGYLPASVDRREPTLQRKRHEYFSFIEQYYDTRHQDMHQDTFRQVSHCIQEIK